ncbi:MAG: HAMP domain-containing protein [Candidatus Omnitrophica bacterium]|nr:HAMP domain-containing protein [Candidatus Omnitrophota bacterium]
MRINIQHKITFIFITTSATILLGVFFYLRVNLKEYTYNRIKINVTKQIKLCKSYLTDITLKNSSSYYLDDIADTISSDLDLRVTIIGIDGTVYGDSELKADELINIENHIYRPEVQQALLSGIGESRRFSTTIKKDFIYIASIFRNNDTRGIIRLSIPLLEVELISNRLKKLLLISFLVAFAITILISFLSSIFISKPIREISLISKEIAQGNFSKKIFITSDDEIGDLAKSFNFMSEQIRLRVQKITANKSRLEAVLLSMFEGVMVIDFKGVVLLMNQPLKNFLCVKEEFEGKRPLEVIRNIEIQEIADKVLKLKKGVKSCEISILVPEEKILLVNAAPILREGKSEGAVLVFHDITNLRRLENIRQDFVANVSHELRTPVSSIKGYAETLLDGALGDKENAKEFLKIIHSDSDRLAKLINDLLDLSRIESDKLNLALKPCVLDLVVRRVVSGLEIQAKAKLLTININIPKNISRIKADENRIAQVLLNLIDNAVKYTNDQGKILISATDQGEFILVDVSDTGIGIPEKDISRLFERFYRVDKARSRELGGTGLGLSIVKHIVSVHHGKVSVQSVLGQGSTFSFTIPKA